MRKIEPVKLKNQLYGKRIEFQIGKNQIKLESEFHGPGFIQYNQIENCQIIEVNKRKLLWYGLATVPVILGIAILYARAFTPPWLIQLKLKKYYKPIKIRCHLSWEEIDKFIMLHKEFFNVELKLTKKSRKYWESTFSNTRKNEDNANFEKN